ncbi:hypothetical protein SDRG_09150 [Saprolegnia diclina VS20]|uniref:Uncharacterized protein n=1 Tax=Saprolegnia diclina (strain VS20) TaxID=1156394 RepID=T0Q5L8_SAPDV|nr:hypothetical protein SDRG_09150 [Saprolegnia diclina VS20]EQC33164.1 hypothetical protein SDRG_09150 [Saprolegnia diclina VS20]|eukprot:XP_008613287.1 hypothetical protein SDRG_09150 [Saprolegnia diclina VS20]
MAANVGDILASRDAFPATYTARDLITYALGIGCSYYKTPEQASTDLHFTSELDARFAAFPLYPVVLLFKGDAHDVVDFPPPSMSTIPNGMPDFNPGMTLHGEQSIEVHRPLPATGGRVTCHRRVLSFHPKGKSGALMETEFKIVDEAGEPLTTLVMGSFYRGLDASFQGQGRTPPRRPSMPVRTPDIVLTLPTSPAQAQLYRLSGDYNPLHIDPDFAASAGFPQPILHGLCTMGVAARALLQAYGHNESASFRKMSVRFSKPTFPGETLETRMWLTSPGHVAFQTRVVERDAIVLDGGEFAFATPATPRL